MIKLEIIGNQKHVTMKINIDKMQPGEVADFIIYLRFLELGGTDEDEEEFEKQFQVLSDNIYSIAEGHGYDVMSFVYNNKIIADAQQDKIRKQVFTKVAKDFSEEITLFSTFQKNFDVRPLKEKAKKMYKNYLEKQQGL